MGKGKTCPPGGKLVSLRGQLSRAHQAGVPEHPQISVLCCLIRQMRDLLKIILPRHSPALTLANHVGGGHMLEEKPPTPVGRWPEQKELRGAGALSTAPGQRGSQPGRQEHSLWAPHGGCKGEPKAHPRAVGVSEGPSGMR